MKNDNITYRCFKFNSIFKTGSQTWRRKRNQESATTAQTHKILPRSDAKTTNAQDTQEISFHWKPSFWKLAPPNLSVEK